VSTPPSVTSAGMPARRVAEHSFGRALPGSRPLRSLSDSALAACLEKALADRDGATGAHCIHEMSMRGQFPTRIEAALERLWKQAAGAIPEWLPMHYVSWLPTAYEVAGRFRASGRGRFNIYFVLLDHSDRRGDPHGVYVGMSRYAPAERFDQHKAGIRAAGSVLKRGIEVLAGPTLHLRRIKRSDAERIEVELADALRDAGLAVQGGH
jgi:hypothetical protein